MLIHGRMYLAKRNVRREQLVCGQCQRFEVLESFDGFLMHHIYWVPLIPAGWVHVHDSCGYCKLVQETPLKTWQAEQRAALQLVASHFGQEPGKLEYAIEALRLLSRYGTAAAAAEVAAEMERRFHAEPEARKLLTGWYSRRGQLQHAAALSDAAPGSSGDVDHRFVARAALSKGDLGLAKEHYIKITAPTRADDYWPLTNLAHALVKAGRDSEAYEVYRFLFTHFAKEAATHHDVVKQVMRIEKRARPRISILPAGTSGGHDALIGAAAVAALVLVILGAEHWTREHQTLYLSNATLTPARVVIDGIETALPVGAMTSTTLSSGPHDVVTTLENGVRTERHIDLDTGPVSLFDHQTFVFDVLGAGVFVVEQVVYSVKQPPPEALFWLHAGRELHVLENITYRFVQAPAQIQTKESLVIHLVLSRISEKPEVVLEAAPKWDTIDARGFAEGQLRGGARDPELAAAYVEYCRKKGCGAEAAKLLSELGVEQAVVER